MRTTVHSDLNTTHALRCALRETHSNEDIGLYSRSSSRRASLARAHLSRLVPTAVTRVRSRCFSSGALALWLAWLADRGLSWHFSGAGPHATQSKVTQDQLGGVRAEGRWHNQGECSAREMSCQLHDHCAVRASASDHDACRHAAREFPQPRRRGARGDGLAHFNRDGWSTPVRHCARGVRKAHTRQECASQNSASRRRPPAAAAEVRARLVQ